MKTDDLIALLSTHVEPADHRQVGRAIGTAVAAGLGATLLLMLLAFGIRTDLASAEALIYLPLKLVFTIAIVILTAITLARLARPGGERRTPLAWAAVPFIAMALLAAVSFTYIPSQHWKGMIIGDQWLECLLSIPIIAILPFAVIVWAVRKMAPTDLVRTGALAGLAAGGVSATGYALHCTDDSLPFVALWYGGTIVLCTIAGAMLGPRLLRW